MQRPRSLSAAIVWLFAALSTVQSAEVIQQVPHDALGFVLVRDLAEADAKAGRVFSAFGSRLPGPLALLKSIAGIQAGLDEERDLMLVVLPPQSESARFSLALWLPVSDYDALVHSLDGDPGRRVAAVTLAGEDLLVVEQGDWAVIMDPDQRDRLEALRDTKPAPPQHVNDWADWVAAKDAVVVILPAGMKTLWSLAETERLFEPLQTPSPAPANQDLFGPARPAMAAAKGWPAIRYWIRATFAERPELARWAAEAKGAACGLRLDLDGNTLVGLKLAFDDNAMPAVAASSAEPTAYMGASHVYASGEFVLTGSGCVSPDWVVPAVAPYVRQVVNDLATNYGTPVDERDVDKFRQGVEQAVADVRSFAVLTRPGSGADPVFTNNFLALRVVSAREFLKQFGECVRLWNAMLEKPQATLRLVFKPKEISVAAHQGTEYSIDMASAVDAPAIPEARASMEKLFGQGAFFRLQAVGIDDTTVLLASATETQVAQVVEVMGTKAERLSGQEELRDAARLLSAAPGWQLFLSPHGYTEWLKRQMDAVLGAVIGGPVVQQFPTTPPFGLAGGVEGNVIWVEAAAPIKTIRGVGQFWRR